MTHRHHPRQRGTVYLLVLSVTSMLVAIGVTAVMVGRVDVKSDRLEADQQQARALAQGAIEVVRIQLENNASWRTSHSNDVWTTPANTGNGQVRYKLADEADADLSDEATDPVRLTVEATVGDAVRVYSITLRDGKTLTEQIAIVRSTDDAGQGTVLGVNTTNLNYMLIGADTGVDGIAGVRFDGVPVAPGQSVRSAQIQFTSSGNDAAVTTMSIWAQAHDDAPTFNLLLWGISSRTKTAAQASWSPGAWTTGAAGDAQRSADLAAVIQEVVDRPGWQSGNAVAFIIDATAARYARTYDYSPDAAPVLHLTYTAPGLSADYTTLRRELAQ